MLNEPALSFDDRPAQRGKPRPPTRQETTTGDLRPIIMTVMAIDREFTLDDDSPGNREDLMMMANAHVAAGFEGKLILASEEAYAKLDELLKPLDYLPLLRQRKDKQLILIIKGRPQPKPRSTWLNWILLAGTVISLLLVGTANAAGEIADADPLLADQIAADPLGNLWRGIPYAAALLLILGAHELGHYFAARRHNLAVTLPYFIPLPPPLSFFGTAGAFIQLREPIKNRKALLDVGAAGPLMGLIFAIPILLIGLATSPVQTISGEVVTEGNSFIYALSKTLMFGQFVPVGNLDVMMNQLVLAGWTGLLVTAINLIPLGQLDGGHILYALIGERARWLYVPVLAITIFLAFFVSESWLLWLMILFFFGRYYAVPLDALTPLNRRRQFIAVLSVVVFIVTFVPIPFTVRFVGDSPAIRDSVFMLPMIGAIIGLTWQRLKNARKTA
jgi:hypothetical protein